MLGFLGAGNMASAIIDGAVSSGFLSGEEIAVYDVSAEKTQSLQKRLKVYPAEGMAELAEKCEKIVLAVKPNVLSGILPELRQRCKENTLYISIAAGKTIGFLSEYLGESAKIIRIMPNINARVKGAVSAFCGNKNVEEADLDFAERLCGSFGTSVRLPESQFPVFGVIGGCSPAFAYMFIDSLARTAVKNGMDKKTALEVSAAAVMGSAKMILESEEHPWKLIDSVCSRAEQQ